MRCSNTVAICPRSATLPSPGRSASAVSTSVPPLPRHAIGPGVDLGRHLADRRRRRRRRRCRGTAAGPGRPPPRRRPRCGWRPATRRTRASSRPGRRRRRAARRRAPRPAPRWRPRRRGRRRRRCRPAAPRRSRPPSPSRSGTLQATSAAVSSGSQGSILTQENSLSSVCRAKAPTMQNPPSGSPSSRKGNVPLGSWPVAIVAPLSHRLDRPCAQNRQCPQAGRKLVTTWSPGATG